MFGPRVGVLLPGGNLVSGTQTSAIVGTGFSAGAEGGFRFARKFYIGAVFEHGFHEKGDSINGIAANVVSGDTINSNQSTNYIGLNAVFISNPDGFGFYGELGLGYRSLNLSYTTSQIDVSPSFSGGEAEIALGMHIRMGEWMRLVPKIGASGGTFSKGDCTESGSPPKGLSCADLGANNGTITSTDSHSFIFVGATAFFDFARKN
jgi:hypothetical protein